MSLIAGEDSQFSPAGSTITALPPHAEAITPSDVTEFGVGRMVFVATGGDVAVEPYFGGNTVTFSVGDGAMVPVLVRRVLATGTTATGLVGVY